MHPNGELVGIRMYSIFSQTSKGTLIQVYCEGHWKPTDLTRSGSGCIGWSSDPIIGLQFCSGLKSPCDGYKKTPQNRMKYSAYVNLKTRWCFTVRRNNSQAHTYTRLYFKVVNNKQTSTSGTKVNPDYAVSVSIANNGSLPRHCLSTEQRTYLRLVWSGRLGCV